MTHKLEGIDPLAFLQPTIVVAVNVIHSIIISNGSLLVYSAWMMVFVGLQPVGYFNTSLTSGLPGIGFAPIISMTNSGSSVPVSSEATDCLTEIFAADLDLRVP